MKNIFFDVEHTLVDDEGVLRPHAVSVIEILKKRGYHVYLWSGVGIDYIHDRTDHYHLNVDGIFDKHASLSIQPDYCVDDDKKIIEKYSGLLVKRFNSVLHPDDQELLRVLRELK